MSQHSDSRPNYRKHILAILMLVPFVVAGEWLALKIFGLMISRNASQDHPAVLIIFGIVVVAFIGLLSGAVLWLILMKPFLTKPRSEYCLDLESETRIAQVK